MTEERLVVIDLEPPLSERCRGRWYTRRAMARFRFHTLLRRQSRPPRTRASLGAAAAGAGPRRPPGELRRERRALLRAARAAAARPRRPRARDVPPRPLPRGLAARALRRADRARGADPRARRAARLAAALRRARGSARCECGAPLLWGSRFCANCGRPVAAQRREVRRVRRPHVTTSTRASLCPRCSARRRAAPGVLPRVRPAPAAGPPRRARAAPPRPASAAGRAAGLCPRSSASSSPSSARPSRSRSRRAGDTEAAVSTATGGSLTVTGRARPLTAPEPRTTTGARRRRDDGAAPPVRAAGATRAARITWPRGSAAGRSCSSRFPQSDGRARGRRASRGGPRAGCGTSASSTRPASQASTPATSSSSPASSTRRRRRRAPPAGPRGFPPAYQREILPYPREV